jgi:hypothetical protein
MATHWQQIVLYYDIIFNLLQLAKTNYISLMHCIY